MKYFKTPEGRVFEAENAIEEQVLTEAWFSCNSAIMDENQLLCNDAEEFIRIFDIVRTHKIQIA